MTKKTLRIASYNIRKARGLDQKRRPDRTVQVINGLEADVVVLQEADKRLGQRHPALPRAMIEAETDFELVEVCANDISLGWHGNAMLVRREFKIEDGEPLDLPTLEPRGAVRGDLFCDGQKIRIVGTHLDLSGLRRRDQIKAILKHVGDCDAPCPTVLMGDFNQWGMHSGAMQEFAPDWQLLTPGKSFPSGQPVARLDRIVASKEWHCVEMGVHHSALAAQASDHLPVFATLELPK